MSLKYSILGLLHYKPMHGYRIKEHIEKNFDNLWSINYGQVYLNLKNLKKEELISMTEVSISGEKGPPRKLYTITEKGRNAFLGWLHDSSNEKIITRSPFLMRFVFFGFGDKDSALGIIDEQTDLYEKQLAKRYANLPRWERQGTYVRLMTELGTEMNEMYLNWLKRARQEILEYEEDGEFLLTVEKPR